MEIQNYRQLNVSFNTGRTSYIVVGLQVPGSTDRKSHCIIAKLRDTITCPMLQTSPPNPVHVALRYKVITKCTEMLHIQIMYKKSRRNT